MIQLKNLKLIGLLTLLVNLNSYALSPDKQTQITQMLAEFLNPSNQPAKGFETWIDELTMLIKQESEFAKFFPVLAKIRNLTNANLVKIEILRNRGLAPDFVQKILSQKAPSVLSDVITARVKRRNA